MLYKDYLGDELTRVDYDIKAADDYNLYQLVYVLNYSVSEIGHLASANCESTHILKVD